MILPVTTEPFELWVIYENLPQHPDAIVVRKQMVQGGQAFLSPHIQVFPYLDKARQFCAHMGLVCLARDPSDDPSIIESWL